MVKSVEDGEWGEFPDQWLKEHHIKDCRTCATYADSIPKTVFDECPYGEKWGRIMLFFQCEKEAKYKVYIIIFKNQRNIFLVKLSTVTFSISHLYICFNYSVAWTTTWKENWKRASEAWKNSNKQQDYQNISFSHWQWNFFTTKWICSKHNFSRHCTIIWLKQ